MPIDIHIHKALKVWLGRHFAVTLNAWPERHTDVTLKAWLDKQTDVRPTAWSDTYINGPIKEPLETTTPLLIQATVWQDMSRPLYSGCEQEDTVACEHT